MKLPPGQRAVERLPVLQYGKVPHINLDEWRLEVVGLVSRKISLSYEDLITLPQKKFICDVHCVTGWSKLDSEWEGFEAGEIINLSQPLPNARFVMLHSADGYATNLAISDFERGFFAMKMDGEVLKPEHGFPLRFVVPHLYFWKSAKWVKRVEFLEKEEPGYWEKRGYHMRGDPWKEERYRD